MISAYGNERPSPGRDRVLIVIAFSYPPATMRSIAERCGISATTARQHVKALLARGFIDTRYNEHGRAIGYRFLRDARRWGKTLVSGVLVGAGDIETLRIAPEFDFEVDNVAFQFTATAPPRLFEVLYGEGDNEACLFAAGGGIDVTVFGATGFMRHLFRWQLLPAGVPVRVIARIPAGDTLGVSFTGRRPFEVYPVSGTTEEFKNESRRLLEAAAEALGSDGDSDYGEVS